MNTSITKPKIRITSPHRKFLSLSTFCIAALIIQGATIANSAVTVSNVTELSNAIGATSNGGDKTILIEPGTYNLNGTYLRITTAGVTVRGLGNTREDVILDGGYKTLEAFQLAASNIQVSNLTIKNIYHHPIHVIGSTSQIITGTIIDNVHIIDPGQQAIKINPSESRIYSVDDGVIKNSHIELTDSGRKMVWSINGSCYTGGIDGHFSRNWLIQDNHINGFWCANGLSEHGVHFWSNSSNITVERNLITDCDRGIGFGLGSSATQGGIIRNNMIYHGEDHGRSDVGIGLESAADVSVYNNTIYHEHPYPHAIEYRFEGAKNIYIANNLTNKAITSRNSGTATVTNNVLSAESSWFNNLENGDLHLSGAIQGVVDSGINISGLSDDIDKELRNPTAIDIGADEFGGSTGPGNPGPPSGLQVVTPAQYLLLNTKSK